MSRITQLGATAPFGLFQTDTQSLDVTYSGQKFALADGREVTLVNVGASNIAQGLLVQGQATVADHQNLAVVSNVTASATAFAVTVTLGATAVTANQYAGGFVVVNAGAGAGQTLRINNHPAANASASLTLILEDSVEVSLTSASSKINLIPNPYAGVIVSPTTRTNTLVGVTLYPVTAASYAYVVSKGITSILADGAIAAGAAISPSNGVAGAVESGVIAQGFVGRTVQAAVDTESRAVYVDM